MQLFACSLVLLAASRTAPERAKRGPVPQQSRPQPQPEPEPQQREEQSEPPQVASIADAFFDSYLRWREACEDLRTAYERWRSCQPQERFLAFDGYRAALEREEHAAHRHSSLAERLSAAAG